MASDTEKNINYITLAEAATGTPYSQEYLSLLVRKGKIAGKKVGRNWHTTAEAVGTYIKKQQEILRYELNHKELKPQIFSTDIVSAEEKEHIGLHSLEELGISQEPTALRHRREYREEVNLKAAKFSDLVFQKWILEIGTAVISFAMFFTLGIYGMEYYKKFPTGNGMVILEKEAEFRNLKKYQDLSYLAAVGTEDKIIGSAVDTFGFLTDSFQKGIKKIAADLQEVISGATQIASKLNKPSSKIDQPLATEDEIKKEEVLLPVESFAGDKKNIAPQTTEIVTKVNEVVQKKEVIIPVDLAAIRSGILTDVEEMNRNIKEKFEDALSEIRFSLSRTSSTANSSIQMVTLSQKIDSLSGTSLASISVNGVTGLTDSDIPNAITVTGSQSLSSLTLTDTLTTSGDLTFSSSATTTIPALTVNAFSIATSSTAVPFLTFDTSNYRIGVGTSTPGATFSIAGNALIQGTLDVGGVFRANSSSLTVNNIPTTAHTFSTWAVNTSAASATTSSLVINPTSAAADTNLLGILVNDQVKFLIDAEGDVFVNSLTSAGSVTSASTTNSSLLIEGSTYIGDSLTDLFAINSGNLIYTSRATSTILANTLNAWSIATSSTVTPFFTFDTQNYKVGIGTTSPTATFSIGGAGNLYAPGGIGAGVSTSTTGALETSGPALIAGAFNVTGVSVLNSTLTVTGNVTNSASTTLTRAGVTGDFFLGDVSGDRLTINAGAVNYTNSATTTIPSSSINAFSYATSSIVTPFLSFDTSNYRIGIGTTSPATTFSIGGAGNLYALGGIGVGVATSTSGVIQTSGVINIGGSGTSTFANGINLTTGCYAIEGTCIGANPGGSDGQVQYNNGGSLGGASALYYDDLNTRIGIGTSTPGSLFSLASLTTNTNANFLLSGINMIYASSSTTTIPTNVNAFSFATSTSAIPMLTFDTTNSRAGFGTTSPSQAFSVSGTGYFGGNVGIGIASPNTRSQLHIVSSAVPELRIDNPTAVSGANVTIASTTYVGFASGIASYEAAAITAVQESSNNSRNAGLAFWTAESDSLTEKMRIDRNGNVGIGTTSPSVRLQIRSDGTSAPELEVRSAVGVGDNPILRIVAGDSNPFLEIKTDLSTAAHGYIQFADGDTSHYFSIRGRNDENALGFHDSDVGTSDLQANIRSDASAQNDDGWATATIDYAEFMEKLDSKENIEVYEVIGVKNGKITKNTEGTVLNMITSTDAGLRGGNPLCDQAKGETNCSRDTDSNWLAVAYIGQMPVLVEGPVREGDYIIPSGNNDGKAKAVSPDAITREQFNQVVGRALESDIDPVYEKDIYKPESDSEIDRELYKLQQRKGNSRIINIVVGTFMGSPKLEVSSQILTDPTNAWSVDQQSGKVNVTFYGTLNLNNNDIVNVNKIIGMDGKWKIDSDGTMIAVKVIADEVTAKKLVANESATFGSAEKRIGITLYDETTGNPFCIKIRDGAMISENGVCATSLNTNIETSSSPEASIPEVMETVPSVTETATTTETSTATTTETTPQ